MFSTFNEMRKKQFCLCGKIIFAAIVSAVDYYYDQWSENALGLLLRKYDTGIWH
jgi:hypothetical protein